MTPSVQKALVILATVAVVLAGLFVIILGQVKASNERSSCVLEYRTEWEVGLGANIGFSLDHPGELIPNELTSRFDNAQADMERLEDLCQLDSWWEALK